MHHHEFVVSLGKVLSTESAVEPADSSGFGCRLASSVWRRIDKAQDVVRVDGHQVFDDQPGRQKLGPADGAPLRTAYHHLKRIRD